MILLRLGAVGGDYSLLEYHLQRNREGQKQVLQCNSRKVKESLIGDIHRRLYPRQAQRQADAGNPHHLQLSGRSGVARGQRPHHGRTDQEMQKDGVTLKSRRPLRQ